MASPRRMVEQIAMAGLPETPAWHLSVDGMTETGPNLSHWPGNRTPAEYKADLTTGICLLFARAPAAEQERFLGGAEAVVNDHYDTDGFLSILAVARPEVALRREELCLAAAGTGDYQSFHTRRAFAIDRVVLGLCSSPESPLAAELAGLDEPHRAQHCYRWLIEHAEQILDQPEAPALLPLFAAELAAVTEQLAAARQGQLVQRRVHHDVGLAVLRSRGPVHRMVLNTLAGAYRVLHLIEAADGTLVRYHDRTESWFEVVTLAPPRRSDLRPLARQLQELEPGNGAGDGSAWCADPPTEPVPELYRGPPAGQEYGQITRRLTPSALAPDVVERVITGFFRGRAR